MVTGTQVAVGNTGGNETRNDGTPTGGTVAPGTEIVTDDATAIGSRDENIIAQQADVILQDEAVANLLQVALILNIGAALRTRVQRHPVGPWRLGEPRRHRYRRCHRGRKRHRPVPDPGRPHGSH